MAFDIDEDVHLKSQFKILGICSNLSYMNCIKKLYELSVNDRQNLESHEYEVIKNGDNWALIKPISSFILIENTLTVDKNYSTEYTFETFSEFINAINAIQKIANDPQQQKNGQIVNLILKNSSLNFKKIISKNELISDSHLISSLSKEIKKISKSAVPYYEKNLKEKLNHIDKRMKKNSLSN